MKRPLRYLTGLLGAALALASCGSTGVPSVLSYEGSYDYSTILVTIIMPGEDFFEYEIQCVETEATITGTDALNAHDACTSLTTASVADRLIEGRSGSGLCSTRNPEEGQIQLFGFIGQDRINTAIDRSDGCGQLEWDELMQYIALPPSAAIQE